MKKLINLFFALAMMFSIVFIGDAISSNGDLSIKAHQTYTVNRRKKKVGIIRNTYRGGRWVVRKTWNGTKWVSHKVWVGTKWTGRKTWRISKKVASRTKKIVY